MTMWTCAHGICRMYLTSLLCDSFRNTCVLCSVDEVNDADNEGGWASLEGEKFARKDSRIDCVFFLASSKRKQHFACCCSASASAVLLFPIRSVFLFPVTKQFFFRWDIGNRHYIYSCIMKSFGIVFCWCSFGAVSFNLLWTFHFIVSRVYFWHSEFGIRCISCRRIRCYFLYLSPFSSLFMAGVCGVGADNIHTSLWTWSKHHRYPNIHCEYSINCLFRIISTHSWCCKWQAGMSCTSVKDKFRDQHCLLVPYDFIIDLVFIVMVILAVVHCDGEVPLSFFHHELFRISHA